jgi:hypothetical protein
VLASLLVGVTGKIDLRGADDAVRAALDLAFDRLDARCPHTPKILLSGLAKGADTIAADAALARQGWSVIAVLPLAEALFLEDFDEAGRAKLLALRADPRVKTMELAPLRKSQNGERAGADELSRTNGEPHPLRADHYEQEGLFISERAAILIAVMESDEAPGKIGGTARIVRHRLTGELDEDACRIVRNSDVLEEPPRLTDRRTGPVWVIDLGAAVEQPAAPERAILVWTHAHAKPVPISQARTTSNSLALADSLEGFNRRIVEIGQSDWEALERRAGVDRGDAASHLLRLKLALSEIQGEIIARVRRSIWQLATLSCIAILAFETYVAWPHGWTVIGSIAYPLLVGAAVLIYWRAARQRWQRFAEDYRGAAEALRVQLVWWASGLNETNDRIERAYLCGAHGALKQLRAFISALIDSSLLQFSAPTPDRNAAKTWTAEQIGFFDRRIASRRREIADVESTSWFLFASSLSVAFCLAFVQAWQLWNSSLDNPKLPGSDLLWSLVHMNWPPLVRTLSLVGAVLAILGLFVATVRVRRSRDEGVGEAQLGKSDLLVGGLGAVAGLILTFGLIDLAAVLTVVGPDDASKALWARESIAIAVVLPVTAAGAIRFVSEKSSWSPELTGYEHAREHFRRGMRALSSISGLAPDDAERREIITALGEEALSENENWLRAHRERPLEPIVGG